MSALADETRAAPVASAYCPPFPRRRESRKRPSPVIPAKAGIQKAPLPVIPAKAGIQ